MLWEVEIRPAMNEIDREGLRVVHEALALGITSMKTCHSARSFLLQADSLVADNVHRAATNLLVDSVVETFQMHPVSHDAKQTTSGSRSESATSLLNVLYKPGVTDNVANSTQKALVDLGVSVDLVATVRKYWFDSSVSKSDLDRVAKRILANDAVERVISGPLRMDKIGAGSEYRFELQTVPIRTMNDHHELGELPA